MSAAPRPASLAARIALVRSRYDPAGGAERFVQAAIAALRAEGVSLSIIARQWPGNDGSAILLDPFHVGSLWRDWGFARAVCREVAQRRFALVQSHERITCCDVYRAGDGVHAQWLAERARVQGPVARLATRLSPHHRYVLAAEHALFTGARLRAVICNSAMVRDEIVARFGTAADKLVLIRNAVDAAAFHPRLEAEMRHAVRQQLGIPREAQVVLHVGSGFERKGVRAMLESVAQARGKPWAVVVGRDKRTAAHAALARTLGLGERVRFVGLVSDARPYYAAADVFVLATLYDPQPNAALEAMACGLPVVTTRKCGVAEMIEEGESGCVRDALDIAGLAGAIERLAGAEGIRVGANGRARVEPFTPQAMAAEYLSLYRRLLHR
ncbi:MAG: glycosyltransferase family 4 protein [Usitatibacter sp.]